MSRENIAAALIGLNLVVIEVIAWGITHGWFSSTFAKFNVVVGMTIAVVLIIISFVTLERESRL